MKGQSMEEATQIVGNYVKTSLIFLIVRDVLIKTTHNRILSRFAKIKTTGNIKYW